MPEIGEVARIVKLLNKHVAGKTISSVIAHEDTIVFKDVTSEAFKKAMEGRTVREARQWGKYFWYEYLLQTQSFTNIPQAHHGQISSSVDAPWYDWLDSHQVRS